MVPVVSSICLNIVGKACFSSVTFTKTSNEEISSQYQHVQPNLIIFSCHPTHACKEPIDVCFHQTVDVLYTCVLHQIHPGECSSNRFFPTLPSVSLSRSLSSATIRNAFLLLLVATSTWLCGLMAVNNSILAFYYIFNVLCLVQVWTKCVL